MKMVEVFDRLPDKLKQAWSADPALQPRLAAGHSLKEVLTGGSHLRQTHAELGRMERAALEQIIRHFGPLPFSEEEYLRLMDDRASGAAARLALLRLRRRGVLLVMRKLWGEHVLLVPRDTYSHWRRICFPEAPVPAPLRPDRIEPEPLRASVGEDVFRLVTLIRFDKPKLTQKGSLHKSFVQKIASLLSLRESDVERLSIRASHGGVYSPSFVVVLDLALRLGLVRLEDGHAAIDPERVEEWLDEGEEERDQHLYDLWKQVHLPAEIGFLHFADAVDSLPRGEWFAVGEVLECVREQMPASAIGGDPDRWQGRLLDEWLVPLAAAGFVQLGRDGGDRPCFRKREAEPDGSFADEWYIQNDFEIIVPPGVSFRLLWDLETVAHVTNVDGVVRGRLDKSSVWKARGMGIGSDELLGLLRRHARYGVPEPVERAVREWAGEYGSIRIAETTLLRCKDASTADELAKVPHLASLLLERLGERDFIVDAARKQELLKWLRDAGYSLDREEAGSSASDGKKEREGAPAGLVFASLYIPQYEWEPELPDEQTLYPDIGTIPRMWLEELRSYHDSTRKQLIEKAIAWGTSVRLGKGGQSREVVPLKIDESRGEWQVLAVDADGRKQRLGKRDWEEMQLILPGINDTKEV